MKHKKKESRDTRTARCLGGRLRSTLWMLALLILGTGGGLKASHYAGTEIIVDWLSGENYRFTQRVYRDCAGITLGTTTLVNLTPAIPVSSVTLNRTSLIDITPLCPGQVSRCASTNGAFGIEEHIYVGTVSNLAANTNYLVAANNLCCRNAAITTVTSAGSQQLYIYSNFRTGIQNSSPRFLNRPFGVFCANQSATLSPNGFDPDGDAIIYSIQSCYDLNANDPVSYAPGFSGLNPLSSSTGISINPNTGTLSFTPTVIGQVAVICVRADEYRNGVVIGSVVRDIQVRIINCNNAAPVIAPIANVVVPVGQQFCTAVSATDANNHMITLTATSGILPPATFVVNSSVAGSATGTFCFTPSLIHVGNTFSVTISAQDNGCPAVATGTYTFNITVPIPCNMTATATSSPAACGTNNGSASVAVANGTAPISYSWTGPSGYTSFNQSNTGLAPGTYSVLVVDGNSCVANATVVVGTAGSSVSATATTTPASCNQNNGSLTVSVTGGTAPYTYSLNGSGFGTSNTFSGLATGNYTFNVLDANGCPASGTAIVAEARDLTPPTINCSANIVRNNDNGVCGAAVSFGNASASDDCGLVSVTQTSGGASGSVFPVGTTTVSFVAVDGSGNTATCSFTVTVVDNQAPSISCPANVTVSTDPGLCGAVVNAAAATATDNCPGVTVVQTAGGAPGSVFAVGTSTVAYQATDAVGNTAACSFTVTVVDNQAPSISCPANVTVSNDPGLCGAVVNAAAATATDNCPGVSVVQTAGGAPGSVFAVGISTVAYQATDAAGNTAACSFTVTVNDTEAPVLTCGNAGGLISRNIRGGDSISFASFANDATIANDGGICGAMYEYDNEVTDNCPNVTLVQTAGLASGSTFPVGATTNTFLATDASGNTSVCSFVLTVLDVEAPSITCPANVTVNNGNGICGAAVNYTVSSSDNCPGATVSQGGGFVSGSVFPIGVTTNSFTVVDASGNQSTCSFTVTVVDASAPSITCPANISVNNDNGVCGAAVSYTVSSTDNCAGSTVAQGAGLASGSVFPVGTTTNSFVATDLAGNTAACSFTVTVVDAQAPAAVCQNVTVSLDNSGNGSITAAQVNNGSSDNCGIASLAVNPSTFTCANVATGPAITNLFISEYIEGSGNNKCIEIYNGTGAAVNLSGYALQFYANASSTPTLTIALTGTVANGDVHVVCQSTAAGNFLAQADQTSASSAWYNGNDAVVLTQNGNALDIVGHIAGNPATEWGTGLNSTADNTLVRNASVTGGNTANAAGFPSVATEWIGFAVNTASNLGSHTVNTSGAVVTLTVTDVNGNASTCAATVTVVDNVAPVAVCQNATVSLGTNGAASLTAADINNGSSDNCAIASVTLNPTTFGCANVGNNNTVVLTVTDFSGNVGTCTATVTVLETIAPTAVCQNLTVQLDANGQASITAAQVNNGSSDNCGIQSLAVSQSSFDCSNAVSSIPTTSDLFFSEYIEGDGNNKCLEIFNGTGAAVNLNGYAVSMYFNGNTSPNVTISLNGYSVAAGDVFVVCQTLAATNFTAQADLLNGSGWYNGNDAVVLTKNGNAIDIIGRIGQDPGAQWGTGLNSTADNTLVRNGNVTTGNTANASGFPSVATEWTGFANNTVSNLGAHSLSATVPTVVLTVTDVNGNTSTCSATVTVQDNVNPTIACPANITVSNDAGLCSAVVGYAATAADNCSATVAYSIAPGSVFAVGTGSVTATATDPSGNTATCSFTVTVNDNEAPVITCPANISVSNDAGNCSAVVSYSATASDNCGIASVVESPVSGSTFAVGTSTVNALATDIHGNTAACSFTVTVNDTEAPAANCQAVTVQLDNSGNGSITTGDVNNGSADNCGIASLSLSNSSFNCANTGTNTVVLTVLDIHGNSSTCTATVTVVDNINPTIVCPANITVGNDAGLCSAVVGYTATAADNCSATVGYSIAPGSVFAVGTASVTATATDPSGNSANCSFTVTVNDTEAPSITCPANVTVSCVREIPAANTALVSTSDNCGVASVAHVGDVATGTGCAGNARVVVRTYSVTDIHGNTASCTQTLTAEATPVVATASNDVVVFPAYADSACATISVVGAGGCAPLTYAWSNGSTATSQNVCPTTSTTYYVTVTDAQGCTGIDSVRVCAIDIRCSGGTNNGQGGTGQGGNGSTNGNGMVHIAICHIPPGNVNNAMVHCIPVPAARQHILQGHGGDYLGACGTLNTRPCRNTGNVRMAAEPAATETLDSKVSLNVFPNPTSGALNVEVACSNCGDEGIYKIKVTDIYGKQFYAAEVNVALGEGKTKLDMSQYAAGVYMIIVENGDQRLVERVVKN